VLSWTNLTELGIGVGSRTIGLKVGDSTGLCAQRYTTLTIYENKVHAVIQAQPVYLHPERKVSFHSLSYHDSPLHRIVRCLWDFNGDGRFDSEGPDAEYVYVKPGTYQAALRVTDDNAKTHSDTAFVTITVQTANVPPYANAGGPYYLDSGSNLALSAAASFDPDSDPIVSYSWDLDADGAYDDATGVNPTITWTQLAGIGIGVGQRTIGLKAVDSQGNSGYAASTLTVYATVAAAIKMSGSPVGAGQTVLLDGGLSTPSRPDRNIVNYYWDMDYDNVTFHTTNQGRIVQHNFDRIGTYRVALLVYDSAGNSNMATETISVQSWRGPVAMSGGPYQVVAGGSLYLDGSESRDGDVQYGDSLVEYAWDLNNDGLFTDVSTTQPVVVLPWAMLLPKLPQYWLSDHIPHLISLRVKDTTGRTATGMTSIMIYTGNVYTDFTMSPEDSVVGQSVVFDGSKSYADRPGGSVTNWEWNFGDGGGYTATGKKVTHTYTSAGTYTIRLRATDSLGYTSTLDKPLSVAAGVSNTPMPPVADPGAPYEIEAGNTLLLDGTASYVQDQLYSITSYAWDIDGDGDYDDAIGPTPSLTWSQLQSLGIGMGSRMIYLKVTQTNGEKDDSYTRLTIR
jgi:PKD repeat protein